MPGLNLPDVYLTFENRMYRSLIKIYYQLILSTKWNHGYITFGISYQSILRERYTKFTHKLHDISNILESNQNTQMFTWKWCGIISYQCIDRYRYLFDKMQTYCILISALVGVVFSDKESAMANCMMWQSIGFSVSFGMSRSVCVYVKIYTTASMLTVAMICLIVLQLLIRKESKSMKQSEEIDVSDEINDATETARVEAWVPGYAIYVFLTARRVNHVNDMVSEHKN